MDERCYGSEYDSDHLIRLIEGEISHPRSMGVGYYLMESAACVRGLARSVDHLVTQYDIVMDLFEEQVDRDFRSASEAAAMGSRYLAMSQVIDQVAETEK